MGNDQVRRESGDITKQLHQDLDDDNDDEDDDE